MRYSLASFYILYIFFIGVVTFWPESPRLQLQDLHWEKETPTGPYKNAQWAEKVLKHAHSSPQWVNSDHEEPKEGSLWAQKALAWKDESPQWIRKKNTNIAREGTETEPTVYFEEKAGQKKVKRFTSFRHRPERKF